MCVGTQSKRASDPWTLQPGEASRLASEVHFSLLQLWDSRPVTEPDLLSVLSFLVSPAPLLSFSTLFSFHFSHMTS